MNEVIFKSYDIRGKYPEEINEKTVLEICQTINHWFPQGRLIIGRDARLSSPLFYKAAIGSFQKHQIVKIGLATTPMFYFLVNKLKAVGGVMITASHNPKDYNGMKIVGKEAQMISGKTILEKIKSQRSKVKRSSQRSKSQ